MKGDNQPNKFIILFLYLYSTVVGGQIKEDDILLAIDELGKWRERREGAMEELENLPPENREPIESKMNKINKQIAYYDSLISDMKKEMNPPRVSNVIEALSSR